MHSRLDRAVVRWLIVGAASLSACGHVRTPELDQRDGIQIGQADGGGSAEVVLRYTMSDAPAAAQVRRALRVAVPVAERWGPLPPRVTITIHPTHDALEAAAGKRDVEWLRAWARRDTVELQSPRTWSTESVTDADVATLLSHELTHCVMFEAIGGEQRLALGIPAWFREGMAASNAGERFPGLDHGAQALTTTAAMHGEEGPLAYAGATTAFRALERTYGRARIHRILARVHAGTAFPRAFEDALGVSLRAFEDGIEGAVALAPSTR